MHLKEILLFLALAGILIPSLQRLRINPVLGFLAAGTLVGPFGLGLLSDAVPALRYAGFMKVEDIEPLAEFGVLALMFMIGLELSAERMWALRRWVFGAGIAQVLASAVVIGVLAYAFGNTLEVALVLGFSFSLSSTAVVMQLLDQRNDAGLRQPVFSMLMLQDLAVVPLFILLGVLAEPQGGSLLFVVGTAFVKAVLAIVLIYLFGQRLIRPLFRTFTGTRQPDVFMALTLLCSLGIAAISEKAGLSMALGAFLAGLLLAETEFRHAVEVVVEPFRGLLLGLFFMSVGMQIDVREVLHEPVLLPLSVLGLFAVKGVVVAFIMRIGGFAWSRAVEGGLLLGQGGEFAFIIVGYALAHKLIAPPVGQFMLLVVGLSLFVTPLAAAAGRAFGDWRDKHRERAPIAEEDAPPMSDHVLIAGFGRVGKLIAQILAGQHIDYVALESSSEVVARQRKEGFSVYYGNASHAAYLHKLHAGRARAMVLTMDDPASALHAVKAIRRDYPNLPVYARSRDEKHAMQLKEAGANLVIPETLETGLQLSSAVLQVSGLDEGWVAKVVDAQREWRVATASGRR